MEVKLSQPPCTRSAEAALNIYQDVLSAVQPAVLIPQVVRRVGDALFIHNQHIDLSKFENVWVAGSGKASIPMADSVRNLLGSRFSGGMVVTQGGQTSTLDGFQCFQGAHPYPDESSLLAGEKMLEFARSVDHRDLVIFVLSGGSSALMESLKVGVTLEDLRSVTQSVMLAGGSIHQLNACRSRLSLIKAGGLAKAFSHCQVVVLVLSDVIGNDLNTIGSGPFWPPRSDRLHHAETRTKPLLLEWSDISLAARQLLTDPAMAYPPIATPPDHFVVGDINTAMMAAAESARHQGLTPFVYGDPLKGEAREMSTKICSLALAENRPNSVRIFGGEPTVTVTGSGQVCTRVCLLWISFSCLLFWE